MGRGCDESEIVMILLDQLLFWFRVVEYVALCDAAGLVVLATLYLLGPARR